MKKNHFLSAVMLLPMFWMFLLLSGCQPQSEDGPNPPTPPTPVGENWVIKTEPAIVEPGYDGPIVLYFNPEQGNGGMKNATQCYAHTGLLLKTAKSNTDWSNTVSDWRSESTPKLVQEGKCWKLNIPSISSFYNHPNIDDVKALVFVFHDGKGGSKEGKTSNGGDIVLTLGEDPTASDIWGAITLETPKKEARPSGVTNGIYYGEDGTSVTLCTYAADVEGNAAKHVYLLGDMTNWKLNNDYQLKQDGPYFWITLSGLEKGKEYRFQYAIERADGIRKQISDVYSEKVLHPDDKYEPKKVDPSLIDYPSDYADGGYVTVIQPGKSEYTWTSPDFVRPDKNNLVIYEVWTFDYTIDRSFRGLMQQLDYIESLGVNALELMPVSEFDGNYNWGYSPNHYFALDKAYGTPEMMKKLVDECHSRGIAVILDMVLNHATGLNPMNKLYPQTSASATETELRLNPWFNVKPPHGDNFYEDWNHDFEPAHEMFVRALNYWIDEYHVDGYRLDLSHGLCGKANNSVKNITDYYNKAINNHTDKNGTPAYLILEHWGNNMSSERPQLISLGCLCWNNTSNAYCQTAMGWLKDGDSFSDASKDGYVSYTCSHDEERPFYKAKTWGNGAIKTDETTRNSRIAANLLMNVMLNGSHMIWQFEEVGYDYSINCDFDHPTASKEDYRCSKKPRPATDAVRTAQMQQIGKAIQLRTRLMPNVFSGNPTSLQLGGGQAVRHVQWGSDVYVVANFDVATPQQVNLPGGSWYDYLSGGSQQVSTVTLQPGEVKVYTGRVL